MFDFSLFMFMLSKQTFKTNYYNHKSGELLVFCANLIEELRIVDLFMKLLVGSV